MIRRLVVSVGCAAAASLMLVGSVAAQTGVLSGVIYDQTNKTGLAGAEVRIKGTELVAVSGKDGRFTIAGVPLGTREIETVRTGYRPYRLPSVKFLGADTVQVYLALSTIPEDGVAGTDVMTTPPEIDADGRISLESVAARVTKVTSIGQVSENAPIYVIDGVMLSAGSIPGKIDEDLIQSVEVIKGAAAESLYGPRAVNGVIIVTTRRPPR